MPSVIGVCLSAGIFLSMTSRDDSETIHVNAATVKVIMASLVLFQNSMDFWILTVVSC